VARANLLAWKSSVRFGVFNAGTGKSTTINAMLALLNKKLGTNLAAKYVENKIKNYVPHTQASTEKTHHELGFRTSVSLEQGVENLIAYYANKPGAKK
jgi:UDP-glucose 4-epimerase